MGIKTFLKRFVAAFGDAAHEELSKDPGPPVDLSNCTSEELASIDVNPISCDYNTFPAGFGHLSDLDETS